MNDIITRIQNADEAKRKGLARLHTELGYPSAQALADAVLRAAGAAPKAAASSSSPNPSQPKAAGSGRGRRVPDAVRSAIATALKAGETAAGLPEKFGVSYNIIHEIKKQVGMVTARSKKRASK